MTAVNHDAFVQQEQGAKSRTAGTELWAGLGKRWLGDSEGNIVGHGDYLIGSDHDDEAIQGINMTACRIVTISGSALCWHLDDCLLRDLSRRTSAHQT
jgi:hypothetical protein